MSHLFTSVDKASFPAMPTPGTLWAQTHCDWTMGENCLVGWITVTRDTASSKWTIAPPMYSKSYTGCWCWYYVFGEHSYRCLCDSWLWSWKLQLSEHHCRPVAPLHNICLPNRELNLAAGQCFMPSRLKLCCSSLYLNAKFQLMSWSPNSLNLNSIEHIWDTELTV